MTVVAWAAEARAARREAAATVEADSVGAATALATVVAWAAAARVARREEVARWGKAGSQ